MFAESIRQLRAALRKIQSGDRASIKSVYETLEQLNIRFEENNWVLGQLSVAEIVSITRVLQSLLNEHLSPRDESKIGKLIKLLNKQNIAAKTVQHIRVFVSSPSDVSDERALAFEVIEQLQYDPLLRGRISVEVVAWDKPGSGTPLLATMTPQEAIDKGLAKPSECDIVITILWARLGTPLGKEYIKPKAYRFSARSKLSETRYFSGTEWELVDALQASSKFGRPFVIVYRKTEEPQIGLKDPKFNEKIEQYNLVEDFFAAFSEADHVIRRGYNQFQTPSDFRKQLEIHLRDLVSQLLAEQEIEQPAKVEDSARKPLAELWKGSPFPGLRAFGVNDAPIFFGRGNDIDGLIEKIKSSNFIAVVSASGAGKSSLVGAGLLPRLQKNAVEGSQSWPILQFSPDELGAGDVFASLAAALQRPPFEIQKPKLANLLREHPEELLDLLKEQLHQPWSKIFLFIDQFEELFTRVKSEDQKKFIEAITHLVNSDLAKVIVTIRADFYSRCLEVPDLEGLIKKGTYPIYAPKRDELREMIERPAEQAGLTFEPGLVRRILDDTGDQPGSLALMAFALQQLYEYRGPNGELQHSAYEEFGGVSGAIGKQAQKAFDSVPVASQASLPKVFRHLIEISEEGIPTRARVELSKVVLDQATETLINELVQQRLLVVNSGPDNHPMVEVAHEALFRSWGKLATWISEIGNDLAFGNRITREARDWIESHKDTSFLLRGTRLEQALAWLKRAELNSIASHDQRDFILESEKQEQKAKFAEVHRRRRIVTNLAYAVTTLGLLAFAGWLVLGGYGQLFTKTAPLNYPVATAEDYIKALKGVNTNQAWAPVIEEFNDVPMALVPTGCFYQGYSQPLIEMAREICQQDKEFDKNHCSNLNLGFGDSTGQAKITCVDKPFWLDVYEVTNAQYGSSSFYQGENRPRDTVEYAEADSYCRSRDAALPTETQWEYAGRGPSSFTFPWGNTFNKSFTNWDQYSTPISSWGDQFQLETAKKLLKLENAQQDFNIFSQSWNVGSRPEDVSWVGAFDMAGNVTEWVSIQGSQAMMKGGSFWSDSFATILAYDKYEGTGSYFPNFGFRCAKSFEFPANAISALLENASVIEPRQPVKGKIESSTYSGFWKFNLESNSTATLDIESDQDELSVLLLNSDGEAVARYQQKQGTLYLVGIPSGDYIVYASSNNPTQYAIELNTFEKSEIPGSFAGNAEIISFDKTSNSTSEWSFEGRSGDFISFEVKSNVVNLIDANGLTLRNDVNSDSGLIHLKDNGSYTLKLKNDSEYTLWFEHIRSGADKQVQLGKELSGSFTVDNHKDYWWFNGNRGDTIDFLIDTNEFYSTIRLYNASGEILSQNNNLTHKSSSLVTKIPDTGTYVLEVGQREQAGGNYKVIAQRIEATQDNRIEVGKQLSASLEEGNRNTFWYFDGKEGDTAAIVVDSNDFSPSLYLYDSAGQLLGSSFDNPSRSKILQLELPASDRYFILANNLDNATGNYTLLVKTTDPYGKDQLTAGKNIKDALEDKQDQDYWYFKGFVGDITSISMTSQRFNGYLSLYDPKGSLVSSTRDGDTGKNNTITYQLQSTGLYTVRTGTKSRGGQYELSIQSLDPALEQQVSFGTQISNSLSLDEGNGVDYWLFDAQPGEIISVVVKANEFHPMVYLYNPGNQLIYSTPTPTSTYPALPESKSILDHIESLQIPVSATGKYRMQIQGWEKIYTHSTYSMFVDKVSVTNSVVPGTSVTEQFTQDHLDRLWFLDAQAGELMFMQVDAKFSVPTVKIYRSDGELLKESNTASATYYGTNNSNFMTVTFPENGRYILRASAASYLLRGDDTFTLSAKSLKTSKSNRISLGKRMIRSLDANKPQEYLFFDGQEGDVIAINLETGPFTPAITLYDSQGQTISTLINTPVLLSKSDIYVVRVSSPTYNLLGSYTLTIDKANEILFGRTNTDDLRAGNLQDIWYFKAQAGDYISINMQSKAFTPTVALFDSKGQSVYSSLNSPQVMLKSDTYAVRVSSAPGTSGSYTLRVDNHKPDESNQLAIGESITDKLDTNNLQDIWYFKAQAGDSISVATESKAFTPYVSLYDSKGLNIPFSINAPVLIFKSDTYVIRVGSQLYNVLGSYSVSVNLFEPNRSTQISLGERIPDELSTENLQDIWYFKAKAGDFISVDAQSDAFTPSVTLYDTRGQTLSLLLNTPIPISRTDTYVARVTSPPGAVGSYALSIDALEPNEKNQITSGKTVTDIPDTLQDIWYFEVEAGDVFSIHLESEGYTPSLSFYDSKGQSTYFSFNTPVSVLNSDRYAIRVSSPAGISGTYSLRIDSLAPNENNQLVMGESVTDRLDINNTQDVWYLKAEAGDFISINAQSATFIPWASMSDLKGQIISSSTMNAPILIYTSGMYTVRVGSSSGIYGSYTLKVDRAERNMNNVVSPGESVSGALRRNHLWDSWLLEGQAGERIVFELNSKEIANPQIILYDPDDQLIAGTSYLQNNESAIRYLTLPKTGSYTIIASGTSAYFENSAYTMNMTELEPSADNLIPRKTTISGTSGINNPADHWFIEAQAGDMIAIRFNRDDLSTVLRLFDANGLVLSSSTTSSSVITSTQPYKIEQEVLFAVAPKTDKYMVLVSNTGKLMDSYTVYVETILPNQINDQKVSGVVSQEDPHEVWSFQAQTGERISILMDGYGSVPYITVWDTEGKAVVYRYGNNGLKYAYEFEVKKSGRYMIQVTNYAGPVPVNYELTLEKFKQ